MENRIACKSEIDNKEKELKALNKNKEDIETARTNLVNTAAVDVVQFRHNITSITTVWKAAQGDTMEIQDWLEKGAKTAVSGPNICSVNLADECAGYAPVHEDPDGAWLGAM